jgi:hypothetical protein
LCEQDGGVNYPQSLVVIYVKTNVAANFRGKYASVHESLTRWTPRLTDECCATQILRIRVGVLASERARAVARSAHPRSNGHRDALEFSSNEIVLLTRLCEGQYATVLQLPASPRVVSSFAHLQAVEFLMRGHMLADVSAIIGSLDIVFADIHP